MISQISLPIGDHSSPPRGRRSNTTLYLGIFFIFVTLYGLTAQRGPAWQDAGIFQWRTWNFDLAGWMGLALAHPLLVVFGKLFQWIPFGPVAWRLNFLSSVCGALAVANVALLVRQIMPAQRLAAWLAAGFFGLAHTTWWLATIDQDQALHVMLFTFQLVFITQLIQRRQAHWALWLGLSCGLALSIHDLALLALPAYVAVIAWMCFRRQLKWHACLLFCVGWLAGAGLFLYLICYEAMSSGLPAAIHSALFGVSWKGAVVGISKKPVLMGFVYIAYNFPNLALPLAAVGVWQLGKMLPRSLTWTFSYLTLIYFGFAIRYDIVTQFMFFQPFYAMIGLFAGIGLAHLVASSQKRKWWIGLAIVGLAVTPVFYAFSPTLCKALHVPLPSRTDLARDPARYLLTPWKHDEDSAGRFARAALKELHDGDTIVVDGTALPCLQWARYVENVGPDVQLLPTEQPKPVKPFRNPDRVFVITDNPNYVPNWIQQSADLEKLSKEDVLFHVKWRAAVPTTIVTQPASSPK